MDEDDAWSFTDSNGVRWYRGQCGGCGAYYASQDQLEAEAQACPQHRHGGDSSGLFLENYPSDAAW